MSTYTILGTDDAVNTCDCCGKTNLKFTVAVDVDGETLHYGSTCATRHTGKSAPQIRREIENAYKVKVGAAVREYKQSSEYLAYAVKLAEAHRNKIAVGKAFKDYLQGTNEAANRKAVEIAAKHGVKTWEVH